MSKKPINPSEISDTEYDLMVVEEELILEAQMVIQRALNERGMSQKDLADKLGVSNSYVSQMLGDSARNLTLRTIARVLNALGTKAVIKLDSDAAEVLEALDEICSDSKSDVSGAAAMASKIASSCLSSAWDHQVVELSSRTKSSGRKRSHAQAYSVYDPLLDGSYELHMDEATLAA